MDFPPRRQACKDLEPPENEDGADSDGSGIDDDDGGPPVITLQQLLQHLNQDPEDGAQQGPGPPMNLPPHLLMQLQLLAGYHGAFADSYDDEEDEEDEDEEAEEEPLLAMQ